MSNARCRGRVQAQGDDIKQKGGYSESWAQDVSVTEQDGLEFLAKIKKECNKDQQAQRKEAFTKAKRFVQNASKQGGVWPESQPHSFQDRKCTVGNARVDIEIQSGRTFIPVEQND